eukprot:Trichotokara_eunicae@DN11278_c0_g1_i1.p1
MFCEILKVFFEYFGPTASDEFFFLKNGGLEILREIFELRKTKPPRLVALALNILGYEFDEKNKKNLEFSKEIISKIDSWPLGADSDDLFLTGVAVSVLGIQMEKSSFEDFIFLKNFIDFSFSKFLEKKKKKKKKKKSTLR